MFILLQLRRQLLRALKLSLASDALHKAHQQELVVDVALKVEDMRLQRQLLAIEGSSGADVHHTLLPYHGTFQSCLYGIYARGRYHLPEMGEVEIGSRESEFPALMIAVHHLANDGIGVAQALVCHIHLALFQERANHGGGDIAALRSCCEYIKKNRIQHPIVYIMACRIGPFAGHFYKQIHKLGGIVYLNPRINLANLC